METSKKEMFRLFMMLRRGLRFWLESFGQNPGLSRDMGLPVQAEPPEEETDGEELLRLVERTGETRALADEMAWGYRLKFNSPASRNRIRM